MLIKSRMLVHGGLFGLLLVGPGFGPGLVAAQEEAPVCIKGVDDNLRVVPGDCPEFDQFAAPKPKKAKQNSEANGQREGVWLATGKEQVQTPNTYLTPDQVPVFVRQIASNTNEQEALQQFERLVAMGEPVVDPLSDMYSNIGVDTRVRWVVGRALGRIQHPEAMDALLAGLKDPDPMVRVASARGLQDQGDSRARGAVVKALDDRAAMVRSAALDTLATIGTVQETPAVAAQLTAKNNFHKGQGLFVRTHAAETLGKLGGPGAVEALIEVIDDKNPDTREAAHKSLLALTGRSTTPPGAGTEKERWKAWWAQQR